MEVDVEVEVDYFPVEPCPPVPRAVLSSVSTTSISNGSKVGMQI